MKTKRAKPKPKTVFTVQRLQQFSNDDDGFSPGEPERVFGTRAAAEAFAAARGREARAFTNPFAADDPRTLCTGGEKAFRKRLKELGVTAPAKTKDYWDTDWAAWWDATVGTLTEAQRDQLWAAIDQFNLYAVAETELGD